MNKILSILIIWATLTGCGIKELTHYGQINPSVTGGTKPEGTVTPTLTSSSTPTPTGAPNNINIVIVNNNNTSSSPAPTLNTEIAGVVAVSPSASSVNSQTPIQFNASATNLSNSTFTWSLNYPAGGTITATGLYSPPSSQVGYNTVQITATSVSNPNLTGKAVVYLSPYSAVATSTPATTATATPSPVMSTNICRSVPEHETLSLSCPGGQVIMSISNSSFGTPSGSCGNWTPNTSCNSTTSVSVVSSSCLGKNTCSVAAEDSVFGDPCIGTFKELIVNAVCGAPTTATPTPASTSVVEPTPASNLTVTDSPYYFYGDQIPGTASHHIFTIKNSGPSSATNISFSTMIYPFVVTSNNCYSLLLATASCQVAVDFKPQTTGTYYQTEMIYYNNGLGTANTSVTLLGTSNGIAATPTPIVIATPTRTPPNEICGQAPEHQNLILTCPAGQVINSIAGASYGTPNGSCGSWTVNTSCNSDNSINVATSSCVGKNTCTIDADNIVFNDPCYGTFKELIVTAECGLPTTTSANAQLRFFNAPTYNYGSTAVPTDSLTHTFSLINFGNGAASNISFSSLTLPFIINQNNCGRTLAANQSCDFSVTFSANINGDYSSPLSATYTSGSNPTNNTSITFLGKYAGPSASPTPILAPTPKDSYSNVVCNPLQNSTYTSIYNGARGYIKYMPQGGNFSSLSDYKTNGIMVKTPVYTPDFNLGTTFGGSPILRSDGSTIQYSDGKNVLDHYSLHFSGQFKLGSTMTADQYQFGLLADDGAILSVDQGTGFAELINNDGDHSTKFMCQTGGIKLGQQAWNALPFQLDYYQGPVGKMSLVLMYRLFTQNLAVDSLCGDADDNGYFDSTTSPSTPKDKYNQLLSRGWIPVPKEFIYLDDQTNYNVCK